jgi:predicted RNA-binding Zn-ribbon protein involved in translation (DUF1610 family)
MFKLAREVMGTRPLTVSCGSCSHRFDIQFGRVLDGEAVQCPACGEETIYALEEETLTMLSELEADLAFIKKNTPTE